MRKTWRRRRVLASLAGVFALVAFCVLVGAVIFGARDGAGSGTENVSAIPDEPTEVALENSATETG